MHNLALRKRGEYRLVVHGIKTGIELAGRAALQARARQRAYGDEHGDLAVVLDVDVRVNVATGQRQHDVHPFWRR